MHCRNIILGACCCLGISIFQWVTDTGARADGKANDLDLLWNTEFKLLVLLLVVSDLFLNVLVMDYFLIFLTPMVFRWWAGEWQKCSTTCGPTGQKKRTVLCIQTVGSDEQALAVTECQHLLKPKTHLSCNRDVLCPSDWTVSNWTEVN